MGVSARRAAVFPVAAMLFSLLVDSKSAWSQPAPGKKVKEVAISPRAAEAEALAYSLLPSLTERRPGNAAPIYLRLGLSGPDALDKSTVEKIDSWLTTDLDKLPLPAIDKLLTDRSYAVHQLHLAARRRHCEWDYTLDDRRILWLQMPDVQFMRGQIKLVNVQTRAAIAKRDYRAAVDAIATSLSMSQHIGDGPFLINALVGLAGVAMTSERLFEFVGQPDAPNLYWSLATLPSPMIDLRRAFDTERHIPQIEIPELADLDRKRLPGEWDVVWLRLHAWLNEVADASDTGKALKRPDFAKRMPELVAAELPAAKQYLVDVRKRSIEEVNSMAPTQAIVLHFHHRYCELRDGGFKTLNLPIQQATAICKEAEQAIKGAPTDLASELARHILPSIITARKSAFRTERRLALLQVVEALRLHLAAGGSLPNSLTEIQIVPLPNDPMTNRQFEARRDGDWLVIVDNATEGAAMTFDVRVRVRK